ncbi:Lytic murein transglycosylase [Sphingobium herbicidovorans NBRC 16415]|uniref:Lytic murein transglycosylase n=1 Tax=Sphingobium herbicidovorans (strain ATCC 700291 / DSM 11019 / CCUG 56400 / KCTC 2939 / LMG 18315 / NBRC 16415 / MH) TaxID=1219045 RepID=A0A086P5N1_SPHHM|nr:lytic transglycosylase domain-containing protein [Sphingobium herbicidovorans]KFG88699.1 Lytic murein transglycosylase [Sphingobium herbicidovorans NBRC 16415]
MICAVIRSSCLAVAAISAAAATPAQADSVASVPATFATGAQSPLQVNDGDKARYNAIFAALSDQKWSEAKAMILSLDGQDPVRPVALSELYLAKDSPRVELFDLLDLINKSSWLPSADQLSRLAQKRGATILPALPQVQKMVWLGSAPRREYVPTTRTDPLAQALVGQISGFIKNDDPAGAESLLATGEIGLTPEGLTEVRQRVAWAYYIESDDANARRMAARALETRAGGDWAAQAHWTNGLASWRQNDCVSAAPAFANVAALAGNADMRAAGAYWAARAYMVCGQAEKVQNLLKSAARSEETFYGLLARETLGLPVGGAKVAPRFGAADWQQLKDSPNVRAAIALTAIGQTAKADQLVRYQARIGGSGQYDALLRLASALNLPATQLWLAHNGPAGKQPDSFARFPAPDWRPDGGWRVDPALIYAHTLQESGFRSDVVSSAGARGLMQVLPGTGSDMGLSSPAQLFVPSTNMEYGQRYLENLRNMSATGGLLPKVMAAYNAGPVPVERWNNEVKDNGDPLLFMESLPYYETRAYVNIVMRNYWMYQIQAKGSADCLTGMAQGMWPTFPTAKGTRMVRLTQRSHLTAPSIAGGSD